MTTVQEDFLIMNNIHPATSVAFLPVGAKTVVQIDDFRIEYLENGQVNQFYSDLSILDLNGNRLFNKKIFVNSPLRFGGITVYQTDWGMAAVIVEVKRGSFILKVSITVPLASLESQLGFSIKAWGAYILIRSEQSLSNVVKV